MLDINEIYSLSDFQRQTKKIIARLKKTGTPHILTVNGKAEFVIQDANSYQKLLAKLNNLEKLVLKSGVSVK